MTPVQGLSSSVLSELRYARRHGELIEIISRFAKEWGFTAFQLAPGPHNPSLDPTALLAFGTYNPEWKRQYATEPSCRHDPAREYAISRAGSVQWRRIFAQVRDPDQRAFIQAARAQGYRDGVTTPIHGPQGCVAIMMFASDRPLHLSSEDEEALSPIAMALHQRVRRLTAAALVETTEPARLTSREIECLQWVLEGKTNWEIGILTGVTARTVQFHLGNAARKLGVVNRVQAAVRALIRGDLSVTDMKSRVHKPREYLPPRGDSSPGKFSGAHLQQRSSIAQ